MNKKKNNTQVDFASMCPSFGNQEISDGQCKSCKKSKKTLFGACTFTTTAAKVTAKTTSKTKAAGTPHVPKAKLRAEHLLKVFSNGKSPLTRKEIAAELKKFGDSENEARYQAAMSVYYLAAFKAITETDGKFAIVA